MLVATLPTLTILAALTRLVGRVEPLPVGIDPQKDHEASSRLILGGSFSIRVQIERYEDGKLRSSTRALEQYSRQESRAVVEVEPIGTPKTSAAGRGVTGQSGTTRSVYHHDAKSRVWLKTSGHSECSASDEPGLLVALYGLAVDRLPGQLSSRAGSEAHVVGAARLLLQIDLACKKDFARDNDKKFIGGIEAVNFACDLDNGTRAEVLYPSWGVDDDPESRGMPLWVNLSSSSSSGRHKTDFVFNFYHFDSSLASDLLVTETDHKLASPFMFPLNIGCSGVLQKFRNENWLLEESDLLATSMDSIQRVSFRARYLTAPASSSQTESLFLAISMRAKLMRRESLLLDQSMDWHQRAKSITIYDFDQRRKYNLVSKFSLKARDYNYSLSNIVDEGNEISECVQMDMESGDQLEFIKFEQLQFMGRTQVEGVSARVFEHDNPDRLPAWLDPRVLVEGQQQVGGGSKEANSKAQRISLVYYFVDEHPQRAHRLGQLLRVRVTVRDPLRNLVLTHKEVKIFNFNWDRLVDSPSGVRAADLFSLATNCLSNQSWRSLKVAAHLEKRASHGDLDSMFLLENRWARNEALGEMLAREFQLPKTHIDQVESATNEHRQSVRLEFRASECDLEQVSCSRLGRGQFLGQSWLMRSSTFAFEDCVWFAHHCSSLIGAEVVFAHDAQSSLCLVDRLYKKRALKFPEVGLAPAAAAVGSDSTPNTRPLNYYSYAYGQHVMYTLAATASTSGGAHSIFHQQHLSKIKPLNYVGTQMSLLLGDGDDESLEIDYLLKHMQMYNLNFSTQNFTRQIQHLGLKQASEDDKLVRKLSNLRLTSYLRGEDSRVPGSWTEALCRGWCLVDVECKSYSFCERTRFKRAECVLSKLDIRQPAIAQKMISLQPQSAALWRHNKVKRVAISTGTGNESLEVSVVFDKRCTTFGKSYTELFDRGHQMDVDLAKQSQVLAVASEDRCAEQCFARNLDYMRGIIRHKLDLDQVQRDLVRVLEDDRDSVSDPEPLERLDHATNWHHRHLKSLCLHYMYADNNSAKNPCILGGMEKSRPLTSEDYDESDEVTKSRPQITPITMRRLVFSHLYERMHGFRLTDSGQPSDGTHQVRKDDSILSNYSRWLEFHTRGHNTQILLATDDVEHCARACTLQTHGPRPACSSFDYVYEKTPNSTGRKYCLLNTQSLHDIGRLGLLNSQISYMENSDAQTQYWHFEPQDSLLMPEGIEDNDNFAEDYYRLGNVFSTLEGSITKSDKCRAFKSISLTITLLGAVSGLLLGLCLARYWILYEENVDEVTFKNRVIRTVHRLSGVSLSLGLQEREVRM